VKKIDEAGLVVEPSDFVGAIGLITNLLNVQHSTLLAMLALVEEKEEGAVEELTEAVRYFKEAAASLKVQQQKISRFIDAIESEQH
jgi:hypothetical protein